MQFKVDDKVMEVLQRIQYATGMTHAQTISMALGTLDWAIKQEAQGKDLAIIDKPANRIREYLVTAECKKVARGDYIIINYSRSKVVV